jgi:hypothetical protein
VAAKLSLFNPPLQLVAVAEPGVIVNPHTVPVPAGVNFTGLLLQPLLGLNSQFSPLTVVEKSESPADRPFIVAGDCPVVSERTGGF